MTPTLATRVAALLTALATALVLVALAVVPFLSPAWVAFEQGRAEAAAWTGFSEPVLRQATDAVLLDLVTGGDFVIEADGQPLLTARERSHMVDVQRVFAGFGLAALVAAVGLVVLYAGARRLGHPERWWSAVGAGARWLVVAIVAAGVVAVVAFEAAFEVFHRLFFTGGSYTFDPRTDRLVQLFPFRFWSETTLALGAVVIGLAILVAVVARRRSRSVAGHSVAADAAATTGQPAPTTPERAR